MITTLLILHGLVAVALLGALVHQTIALWWPASSRTPAFVSRLRSVQAMTYANAVIVMYIVTFVLGSLLYPAYRIDVRAVLESMHMKAPTGIFEIKEHFAALGLGMLPSYWYFWKKPMAEFKKVRASHAAFLAFGVSYSFLSGHILSNIRGFGL